MKKRFISFMLAAAMIVSMMPLMALTVSAADVVDYRTIVTTDHIEVDGSLDEAYKNSEKITSNYWGVGNSTLLSFESYTVATTRGLYVWAEIKDNTLNKQESERAGIGDKFQIYIRFSFGSNNIWGYYDTDYLGRHYKTNKSGTLPDTTYATEVLSDGSGWRSELFIPFDGIIDPAEFNELRVYIGLQANNAVGETNTAYCYDKKATSPYYYTAYDLYSKLAYYVYDDVPLLEDPVYVGENAPTMDGEKDEIYSASSILLGYVKTMEGYEDDTYDDLGTISLVFDDNYIYAYYEREDKDIVTATSGNSSDYIQLFYLFGNNGSTVSGYFCTEISPNGRSFYGSTGATYGYPGTALSSSQVTVSRRALGNDRYGVEFRIAIPAGERANIAAGKAINFNFDVFACDYANSSSRRCYGGWNSNSPSRYIYNITGSNGTASTKYKSFPELTADKGLSYSAAPTIKGASVALGSDITVNYYATIGAADVNNAYMTFTKNGKTSVAYPKKTGTAGEYKFACVNVAPQAIGDNIKAELVINGSVVASHDNYSVLQNCLNIYNNSKYSATSYNNMKMLIKALLNYGTAAQNYIGYNTDAPVNSGYEIDLLIPSSSDSVKNVGDPISSTFKFTALGVNYDNTNRIYAKFIADSLSNVTVTINGSPAPINKVDGEENTYIAYSDSIPVTRFGSDYVIILSNGEGSQVVTYSVNSYAYAKASSSNNKMSELAKATFTYGETARKYANFGVTSYKVMTYNDGDNATTNVAQVADIINTYKPDLVGMQEVRKIHTQSGSETYHDLLSDYTVVYYDKDSSNNDVPVIYYLTSKFDLLDSGIKWLSDTPDVSSKYDESEYLRCFIWAKLKDKATGEVFVMVNTHIDFAAVSLKQTNKLLELTSAIAGDLPVIYTADWNFKRDSESAEAMNAAGYYSTEEMSGDKYTPGTFINSDDAIDFCFASPSDFRTLDYKVINDHKYSNTASDHYPVISEIVFVEIAEQVDLDKITEGPFDGADDTDGF